MTPNPRVLSWLGMSGLLIGTFTASQGLAVASTAPPTQSDNQICTGTVSAPGTLAGTYGSVVIAGACVVNAGPADVTGNLTIAAGGALTAIFGRDDQTGGGNSDLTVHGNLVVDNGGSLMLGCDSQIVTGWSGPGLVSHPSFPCFDDPNRNAPTLNTHDVIDGNLISYDPLGVVMHHTTVGGDLIQNGGGAGLGCVPVGIFKQYVGFPEYSDYEDNQVDGNVNISGLDTCWFGTHRNMVGGNMTVDNNVAGKDAMEVDTSTILGNLSCQGNSPPVELGDGNGSPDLVGGDASGQCGFDVLLANPTPGADDQVTPTYQPAAVPLYP
jgi:hypothetical protein